MPLMSVSAKHLKLSNGLIAEVEHQNVGQYHRVLTRCYIEMGNIAGSTVFPKNEQLWIDQPQVFSGTMHLHQKGGKNDKCNGITVAQHLCADGCIRNDLCGRWVLFK